MKPKYLEKYPHIFTPLTVGAKGREITFKNRLMVAPLEAPAGCDFNGRLIDSGIDFYAAFIKGGFSAYSVTMEIPHNAGHPRGLVIDSEENVAFSDCHKLHRLVHSYNGISLLELTHPGFCALPKPDRVLKSASEGMWNGNPVKAMDYKDMCEIAELFAHVAVAAKRAGFDMIQLNGSNGWLISQFLSPLTNRRTDEFGGSVENRCRFPRMIIEYIRQATDDMPIELRMNAYDGLDIVDGIRPEDAAWQALIFEDAGVSMLHLSCGNRLDPSTRPEMTPSHFLPSAINLPGAVACKKAGVKIPVGIVGKVHEPQLIEQLLSEKSIDYVFMTRQAIADPEFANKIKEDRIEDIRPCLHCNYCADGGRRGSSTKNVTFNKTATYNAECSVNPLYGQGYYKLKIPAPQKAKNVAVIGGGVAGMVAAITAARRGHAVTLFEQDDKLGGLLAFADHMWFKDSILNYRKYLIRQIAKNNVQVYLNTKATPETIEPFSFDAIIVAIGGKAIVPNIHGIQNNNVFLAMDALSHPEKLGKKVAIIGGGAVGCEISIQLSDGIREITVVEMGDELVATSHLNERVHTLKWMEKNNVQSFLNTVCVAIDEDKIYLKDSTSEFSLFVDSVILCTGFAALTEERDSFQGHAFDVINVGDCKKAANIRAAVDAAYSAAMIL